MLPDRQSMSMAVWLCTGDIEITEFLFSIDLYDPSRGLLSPKTDWGNS
jgi:hypothetical protein